MDEISHYNLFSVLTAREAAYLAVGLDPALSKGDARARTILSAMEHGINGALQYAPFALTNPIEDRVLPEWGLVPNELALLLNRNLPPFENLKEAEIYVTSLRSRWISKSPPLLFSRNHLGHWFRLKGAGFEPVYSFEMPPPEVASVKSQELLKGPSWPWGNYETRLLRKVAEAVQKFWVNFDPTDPTTAPTNAQIVEWLKAEGVAERTAESIATILRVDGLPPGPRR